MNTHHNAFLYFFTEKPHSTLFVIACLFLSSLLEALGITAFLPFLQLFIEGKEATITVPIDWVDAFLKENNISLDFKNIALFIVCIFFIKAGILWLTMRYVSGIIAGIANNFRHHYIGATIQAKWSFQAAHSLGESLNALSTETQRASNVFSSCMKFIVAIAQVLIYTISALILSWQVYLIIIATGIIITLILWSFVKISRKAGGEQTDITKSLMRHIGDVIRIIKPMRAMQLQQYYVQSLFSESNKLRYAHYKTLFASHTLRIFYEPLFIISAVVSIYVAVEFLDVFGSELVLMMVFFVRIMTALNHAQIEYQSLVREQSAFTSLTRSLAKMQGMVEELDKGKAPPADVQGIFFEDVGFAHDKERVLDGLNMRFEEKSLNIVMGESGAGKTTILDLLARFSDPHTGQILVHTTPLRTINRKDWRAKLGFVPQDIFLLNTTIRENVLLGRTGLSDDEVWEALRQVGAYDFVASAKKGLSFAVGENGQRLSGGQKQRLLLARAIIHRPAILLLDEPTSALDAGTGHGVMVTLKELSQKMIVVMATHNKSAGEFADQVIMLEKMGGGGVTEKEKKNI